jgi:dienelactone hydrolase
VEKIIGAAVSALAMATFISGTPVAAQQAESLAPAGKGRVATAVFAQLPVMRGARLSPDGTKIVYQMALNGSTAVSVQSLDTPNAKPFIFARGDDFTQDEGDRTVNGFRWVGNNHVVVTLVSRDNFGGTRGDLVRLVAYDVTTGKRLPLAWDDAAGNGGDILDIDHDKGTLLVARTTFRYGTERANRDEVIRINVATGKFETVMLPNPSIGGWDADSKGVVRGGRSYDGDSGKNKLYYRSTEKENIKSVESTVDKDFVGAGITPQIYLNEPDMVIATSNKDGFTKVYKVNMKTMVLGEPIFSANGYDVDGALSNWEGDAVDGFTVTEAKSRTVWIEPRMQAIQKFMDDAFGVGNVGLGRTDRNFKRMVVGIAKPNQAGGFYLYNIDTGKMRQIGWSNPILKNQELNEVSAFKYKASDGKEVEAILTMPRHRAGAKKLPVVVLTHGGPYGPRDEVRYDDWAQAVAELGYVVVQPNYRGSGGYGKEWLKLGRNAGFGMRMQDDLNDVVDHLAAKGVVDPTRACMMGWSYGGYASARAAQRDPDRWRCTIAGAGVYDLPKMRDYDKGYLGQFGANYLAKGAESLTDVSPARNAKGRWSPILIVHGVRDARVPIDQARTLVSALKSAGKTKGVDYDYIEQPKNTHNLLFNQARVEWLEGAENWLARFNPAYVPSDPDKPVPVTVTVPAAPAKK